jgi:hypothetical protein
MELMALEGNYREVCRRVGPHVKVMASLKANAYGHGIAEVARALSSQGAFALACGSFHDALKIRQAGISAKLILFGSYLPRMVNQVVQHELIPTVYNVDAPTRAAVAPVHSDDPGWLDIPQPGGSQEVDRGPRRREAVGASGRRIDLRVLGPLARPITRMQPPQARASALAIARAADPPPR